MISFDSKFSHPKSFKTACNGICKTIQACREMLNHSERNCALMWSILLENQYDLREDRM